MQVKLLRVLQERALERLGANEPRGGRRARRSPPPRSTCCSWRKHGRFRADLYYRLNVVDLDLPPLRERREDIPLLLEHFCSRRPSRYGRPAPRAGRAQLHAPLMAHDWPGNVRELRNVAERLVLGVPVLPSAEDAAAGEQTLAEQVDAFERVLIEGALWRSGRNVSKAASTLGLPRKTLYDKLKRHGIALRDIQDE